LNLGVEASQKGTFLISYQVVPCRRSTILSVANGSGKMSVHERTDIEHQGTEPVTDLERRVGATLVDA
jgi:hypothetical protein